MLTVALCQTWKKVVGIRITLQNGHQFINSLNQLTPTPLVTEKSFRTWGWPFTIQFTMIYRFNRYVHTTYSLGCFKPRVEGFVFLLGCVPRRSNVRSPRTSTIWISTCTGQVTRGNWVDKQTNKQTTNQPTNQTNKQTNNQTNKQPNKQASKQTNKQPTKQTNNQPTKQTNKQASIGFVRNGRYKRVSEKTLSKSKQSLLSETSDPLVLWVCSTQAGSCNM